MSAALTFSQPQADRLVSIIPASSQDHRPPFHGSYRPSDVELLLTPIQMPSTPLYEKELLIQSGAKHYSELITREDLPSKRYLDIFHLGLNRHANRLARDAITLAGEILNSRIGSPVLVSLVRAGTPIGAVLRHVLRECFSVDVRHYSLSIIRDRGLDERALAHIVRNCDPHQIVFIDGWTAKGVIARELSTAVKTFNARNGASVPGDLFVIADLAEVATASATTEDYLIPCGILNSTVSGLVSRSILNADFVG